MNYRDAPWDTKQHTVAYFNHVNKSVKQLDRPKIASNKIELLHQDLYTFKESGDLDPDLVNWHALPELYQTWTKTK